MTKLDKLNQLGLLGGVKKMILKVEIFQNIFSNNLQEMINKFIEVIPETQIVDIQYTHNTEIYSAMIIYKTCL